MNHKSAKPNKFIYWTPRILSIIFILFLALFSLDVFEMGLGFWGTTAALLIHNIPSFVLTAILIISWKYEIVGGITFVLAGLIYATFVSKTAITTGFEWYYVAWAVQISGVAFIVGILFLIGWKKKN